MSKRRWIRVVLVALALVLGASTAQAQRGRQEEEEMPHKRLPILQYTVAVVCGSLALWSVLRSSRRGWS